MWMSSVSVASGEILKWKSQDHLNQFASIFVNKLGSRYLVRYLVFGVMYFFLSFICFHSS